MSSIINWNSSAINPLAPLLSISQSHISATHLVSAFPGTWNLPPLCLFLQIRSIPTSLNPYRDNYTVNRPPPPCNLPSPAWYLTIPAPVPLPVIISACTSHWFPSSCSFIPTALFISSRIKILTKFYQTLFYNTLYAYFYIFL